MHNAGMAVYGRQRLCSHAPGHGRRGQHDGVPTQRDERLIADASFGLPSRLALGQALKLASSPYHRTPWQQLQYQLCLQRNLAARW